MLDLTKLPEAVRYEGGISRRLFLAYCAALSSLPYRANQAAAADRNVTFSSNPFSLGVASGDSDSQSVVLWTRLAPQPLEPYGGMTTEPCAVNWEVADDEGFTKVVASGTATAMPQLGHSVHVVVQGLTPDRWYFYRFRAGDAESPVGRMRTFPDPHSAPDQLRMAFTSCQHYEQGLFTGYEQMAQDDLDLVFHLGDYIYEDGANEHRVRKHHGAEVLSLGDYRVRYSQYRMDPLLSRMHANCPWFVTWDDHEVDNNYANFISEHLHVNPVEFLKRRASAYQAYYEMMPLRPRSVPRGPDMQLYRRASYGKLAEFLILDTRQYRTDQPNGDQPSVLNEAALNPRSTMLGHRQFGWLKECLLVSEATWNVMAQQVMMGMVTAGYEGFVFKYSMDQWPGYAYERMELGQFLQDRRVPNPIVLTGDIHSNWASELRVDDRKLDAPPVATEFVTTSLTSGGNGEAVPNYIGLLKVANPFVKYHSTERGYVRCTITPQTWKSDFVAIDDVLKPGGKALTRASVVVENGKPAIHPA